MNERRYKYDMVFSKKGDMRYISHLDLMKAFRRAIRRADLPFVLTKGFTPRLKISIPRALKLGLESDGEKMILFLSKEIEVEKIKSALNSELPEGIKVERTVCDEK